jgi:hypothetical protein
MTFLTPSIIKLRVNGGSSTEFNNLNGGGSLTLSDHSRSPLSITYDVLSKSDRMADGTLKRYVVARKKIIQCQWSMLPTIRAHVADGNADARDMKEFYESNLYRQMDMTMNFHRNHTERAGTNYSESVAVYWNSFSFEVVKRYKDFDYWNVTAEFLEV